MGSQQVGKPAQLEGPSDLPLHGHTRSKHLDGDTLLSKGRGYREKVKKKSVRKIRDFAVCGQCMEFIDLNVILPKIWNGEHVEHECGRVLNKGKK